MPELLTVEEVIVRHCFDAVPFDYSDGCRHFTKKRRIFERLRILAVAYDEFRYCHQFGILL
ncbi:unnamed protein product [Acanthoscelides obtectus]|uniref:Uncharacterized protein n=1 Tax=Acanthoscelides obtectus TaxID=200917 RepID=A0A9P0PIB2_ACAOB|nr:unnamed protein product [Acanthoscelides obtectus]CAK1676207.1 hypothetical protein AOBTE_LOCUS30650 [Acanthoscelides obtectus]